MKVHSTKHGRLYILVKGKRLYLSKVKNKKIRNQLVSQKNSNKAMAVINQYFTKSYRKRKPRRGKLQQSQSSSLFMNRATPTQSLIYNSTAGGYVPSPAEIAALQLRDQLQYARNRHRLGENEIRETVEQIAHLRNIAARNGGLNIERLNDLVEMARQHERANVAGNLQAEHHLRDAQQQARERLMARIRQDMADAEARQQVSGRQQAESALLLQPRPPPRQNPFPLNPSRLANVPDILPRPAPHPHPAAVPPPEDLPGSKHYLPPQSPDEEVDQALSAPFVIPPPQPIVQSEASDLPVFTNRDEEDAYFERLRQQGIRRQEEEHRAERDLARRTGHETRLDRLAREERERSGATSYHLSKYDRPPPQTIHTISQLPPNPASGAQIINPAASSTVGHGHTFVLQPMPQKGVGKGGTYDDEINKIMDKYPNFLGVWSADEFNNVIPKIHPNKQIAWIANTDTHDKKGTHWVAFFADPQSHSMEFFDPFGKGIPAIMEKQIPEIAKRVDPHHIMKLKVNSVVHQNPKTNTCAFHSMKFVMDRFRGVPFAEATGYNERVKDQSKKYEAEIQHLKKLPPFKYIS